jgi:Ca-activated chloride channel homolog
MNNKIDMSVKTDKSKIYKDKETERVMEIAITAPHKETDNEPITMNLALVIDRSGSMSGGKLEFAKKAAQHVVEMLKEDDRLTLVSFDDEVKIHSSAKKVSEKNRQHLMHEISRLHSGGSTFLSGGWLAGCESVASEETGTSLNRVLLLTDGQANVGITDSFELGLHARNLNQRNVSTTTLGVGLDFDHFLLESMAEMGGGNYYFIEDAQSIPAIFQKELKELAAISARAVEIVIQLPAKAKIEILGGWRTETDSNGTHIMLGDLASDVKKSLYLKITTQPMEQEQNLQFSLRAYARDEKDLLIEKNVEITLLYADAADVDGEAEDEVLMREFATVSGAEAANEALRLEREGQFKQAQQLLRRNLHDNARHLRVEEIKEYTELSNRMENGLNEFDRKSSNFTANIRRKNRI